MLSCGDIAELVGTNVCCRVSYLMMSGDIVVDGIVLIHHVVVVCSGGDVAVVVEVGVCALLSPHGDEDDADTWG